MHGTATDQAALRWARATATFDALSADPTTPLRTLSNAKGRMQKGRTAAMAARVAFCKALHPASHTQPGLPSD